MTLLLVVAAFLVGSFPSGVVLARLFTGRDVRLTGSGNIGAANVARLAGRRIGIAVAVLDGLKGFLPVIAAERLGIGAAGLALVALATVLGHDFSVFLRLRGGKGIATSLGMAFALTALATLPAAIAWLVVWTRWRYSSLASLTALAVLPLAWGFTGQPEPYVVLAFVLFLLAVAKHWPNIVRLANGTERRRKRA